MALPNVPANLVPGDESTLIRRIEEIERVQRETLPAVMSAIAPMIADIRTAIENAQAAADAAAAAAARAQTAIDQVAAQQTQLAAQQAALAAQVNRIDALVSSQVTSAVATANTGGAIAIGTGASYAEAVLAVPSGYSRAAVFGVTSITATGTAPSVQIQTNIAGQIGFMVPVYGSSGDIAATGATSHAAAFSGLSGGSIGVSGRIAGQSGVNSAYIVNSAVAVFFR